MRSPEAAIAHAEEIAAAGADRSSTSAANRPGPAPIRSCPPSRFAAWFPCSKRSPIACLCSSASTRRRARWPAAALDAGATIINDISAGRDDPQILTLAARKMCPIILMHMLGRPKTMQQAPHYEEVTPEVAGFLDERIVTAGIHGVAYWTRYCIDPGIGFGKTRDHNLDASEIVAGTDGSRTSAGHRHQPQAFHRRKSPAKSDWPGSTACMGTAATVAWSLANGASIVRVHDVEPIVQVVRMIQAIMEHVRSEYENCPQFEIWKFWIDYDARAYDETTVADDQLPEHLPPLSLVGAR